jgi:hypothetical protein
LKLRIIGGSIYFLFVISITVIFITLRLVKLDFVAGLVEGLLIGSFSPAWKYFFGKTQEKSEKIIFNPLKEYVPELCSDSWKEEKC